MTPELRKLLTRAAALDAAAVSDALDTLGCAGVADGIRRLSAGRRIAGRAVTVELGEPAGRAGPHLGVRALGTASPGDVLVVAAGGRRDAAAWGGLLSLAAVRRGIGGVVIDGACRDLDAARALDFPVFARGAVPRSARGRIAEVATNGPVVFGGVRVATGDLVFADASGLAFVAAERAVDVIAAAEAIAARERDLAAAILSGCDLERTLGASYERLLDGVPHE